ncbi:MAG: ferric reductase-like transmembrane domain-containing protein [Actinobacteria bacterium]|nr:ferric reductase-like transmembrane domain-containing protein [Actinomycetota bacterium]
MSILSPGRSASPAPAPGARPGAAAGATREPNRTVRRLPRPRASRLRTGDLLALPWFVTLVTVGLWVRHGGVTALLSGGTDTLLSIGQISGLIAALAAMGGLILSSRPRFLERRYGQDQLIAAHRWFGIVTVFTVVLHAVADTWAWGAATGGTIVTGLVDLLANEAWMVAALVGTVLMVVIGLSSWRRLRQLMPYETWYFVHLTGYLAVLLGFGHQLTLGADIATDTLALWWWWALAIVTVLVVTYSRLGDLLRSLTRRFYVTAVSREANGIGSVHVSGPGLARLRVAGGQFFNIRALTGDLWWQAHPYSVSAAPTTAGLRFTVKELGEDSTRMLQLKPGTRLLLEGPYGVFTSEQAHGAPVVLVAGGVGIAPIRALLEDCGPHQTPVVIVRVHDEFDLAHKIELERLVASRNGSLHVLTGPRQWFTRTDPFSAQTLRAWIPDVASRHVFMCGPASLESAVMKGMRKAGVPTAHIHSERFGV